MPYPEALVRPMREELTRLGVQELYDTQAVDTFLDEAQAGTSLVIVNSVCGCAAAMARPAVAMAMQAAELPDRFVTVFAGQDLEATAAVRDYLAGIPPSSPFMALMKDGDPVFVLERRHIEGRSAAAIATDLVNAYARHCSEGAAPAAGLETPQAGSNRGEGLGPSFRSIL